MLLDMLTLQLRRNMLLCCFASRRRTQNAGHRNNLFADIQVAVKKLPTAQVSSAALSEFKLTLQTLAFASSMCNRLCRLLGFIVIDGNICLVMRRYQQSLQQLLASPEGKFDVMELLLVATISCRLPSKVDVAQA